MSKEKHRVSQTTGQHKKDSRIDSIWLLSNGWITVCDKKAENIIKLCGAYSISFHNKLKEIAPETTDWYGFSTSHIEFAVDRMNKYGKPK